MKRKRLTIDRSRAIEDLEQLQLMALLRELVRDKGIMKTTEMLGIDYKTVTGSLKAGRLSRKTRWALGRALQYGVGSAAGEQCERSDKLEARLDKMERQVKELKKDLRGVLTLKARLDKVQGQHRQLRDEARSGLKRLRMSLDGVRKYYRVQRRLIEQRLSVLEAGREGTENEANADDGGRIPEFRSITPSALHPREFRGPTQSELLDAEERLRSPLECAVAHAEDSAGPAGPAVTRTPRWKRRSMRKLARSKTGEDTQTGLG